MKYLLIVLCSLVMISCETDPQIWIPSEPSAIVYAIFDDSDTVHHIVVEKSFGAIYDPATDAKIYDSLFFDELEVTVEYQAQSYYHHSPWEPVEVFPAMETNKDSGYFNAPNRAYYYFNLRLRKQVTRYVDSVRVTVKVPGFDDVYGQVKILDSLIISTPKKGQQFIYLVPGSTFKIHWDHSLPGQVPHPMNEVDVSFEFIEETSLGFNSKFVKIQNILWSSGPKETYREMSITYEEFIKEVLQQIPVNDSVIYTYLGYIDIHIAGADTNLVQYKRYLNGYSDYHFGGYSNIENGYGLLTSVTHSYKDSMRFDRETRQTLLDDGRLKRYKLSPWTEAGHRDIGTRDIGTRDIGTRDIGTRDSGFGLRPGN
jgi:hypothetical protein